MYIHICKETDSFSLYIYRETDPFSLYIYRETDSFSLYIYRETDPFSLYIYRETDSFSLYIYRETDRGGRENPMVVRRGPLFGTRPCKLASGSSVPQQRSSVSREFH